MESRHLLCFYFNIKQQYRWLSKISLQLFSSLHHRHHFVDTFFFLIDKKLSSLILIILSMNYRPFVYLCIHFSSVMITLIALPDAHACVDSFLRSYSLVSVNFSTEHHQKYFCFVRWFIIKKWHKVLPSHSFVYLSVDMHNDKIYSFH